MEKYLQSLLLYLIFVRVNISNNLNVKRVLFVHKRGMVILMRAISYQLIILSFLVKSKIIII